MTAASELGSGCPVIAVTGTDFAVGKTVAVAAIAAALRGRGQRVVAVKLAQTGVAPGAPGDTHEIARLAGVEVLEYARLPDPLAPDLTEHTAAIAQLARSGDYDIVLVEGTGGLLVRLDEDGGTLADLAAGLRSEGVRTGFVIVSGAARGALNHTALTLEALRHRELDLVGVVVGAHPTDPDLADSTSVVALSELTDGLLGQLPQNAASLTREEFRSRAADWIAL